jgi:hypothetical protein
VDAREDEEGRSGDTRLGQVLDPEQMRDILRRVRKERKRAVEPEEPEVERTREREARHKKRYTSKMLHQIKTAVTAIEEAQTEGRKHLCLTDADARMMMGGRERQVRECHSFEVAVDSEAGLLVVGQSTQESHDNDRLPQIIAAANAHEPEGVKAVTADSGYFAGDVIGPLIEQGIDTCVPDTNTACDLHRGEPIGTSRSRFMKGARFEYDPSTDSFTCEAGHLLAYRQQRDEWGQHVRVYEARTDCQACGLATRCLSIPKAAHRTLRVSRYAAALEAARNRFAEPAHQQRYRHRGEQVETVFGFLRGALGYNRWLLRGNAHVAAEARLFKIAYQVRKIHAAALTEQRQSTPDTA